VRWQQVWCSCFMRMLQLVLHICYFELSI
jgi:hypothetical protein